MPFSCEADNRYAPPIDIPEHHLVNLLKAPCLAIDIGGSLAKLVYVSNSSMSDKSGTCNSRQLNFVKFETRHIAHLTCYIKNRMGENVDRIQGKSISVTGGGAHKYKDLIEETLGLKVNKQDEMDCLIKGSNFLLSNIPNEAFALNKGGNPDISFQKTGCEFPYLLVNIGSGVSMLKVHSDEHFERVGGTAVGGGTFWGLGSLLTKAQGFDELLALAQNGDSSTVDMLVKDIYGGSYDAMDLPGDLVASSFGKAARSGKAGSTSGQFEDADIAKSLLRLISNSIGQIAYLHANLYGCSRIIFGGFFIRGKIATMRTISYAIDFWSKGKVQALFLSHEGYLGAVGAFVKGVGLTTQPEKYLDDTRISQNLETSSTVSKSMQVQLTESETLKVNREDQTLVQGSNPDYLNNSVLEASIPNGWINKVGNGIDSFSDVIIGIAYTQFRLLRML